MTVLGVYVWADIKGTVIVGGILEVDMSIMIELKAEV